MRAELVVVTVERYKQPIERSFFSTQEAFDLYEQQFYSQPLEQRLISRVITSNLTGAQQ